MGAVLSWFDKSLQYFVLRFDRVDSESATFSSELTKHAVEVGADISDHMREQPTTASLEVFVTQKPINGRSLVRDGFNDAGPQQSLLRFPIYQPAFTLSPGGLTTAVRNAFQTAPPTSLSVAVLKFFVPVNRPEQVLAVLYRLQREGTIVEMNAPSYSVQNAVVTSFSPSRGPEDGQGLRIAIELETVRRVSARLSAAPLPAEIKAKRRADKGTKAGEEVPIAEVHETTLSKLLGNAGRFAAP